MSVRPIPPGYPSLIPCLSVKGAPALIDFLKRAFDATPRVCHTTAEGVIAHAEVRIGDSLLMMGEASDKAPANTGVFYVYCTDVAATYARAVEAGGTSVQAPTNQFWGDRTAWVRDASGNAWWIATHVEDVSPEDLERRAGEATCK